MAALRPTEPKRDGAKTGAAKDGATGAAAAALAVGARVVHDGGDGGGRQLGTVTHVHSDDGAEPYYTVVIPGGGERSTEGARLTALAGGWPPFASVASAVYRRTELPGLDHGAGGVWEVPLLLAAGKEAEAEAALPARSMAEALRYLGDCLRHEARALDPAAPAAEAAGARLASLLSAAESASGDAGTCGSRELLALIGRCLFAPHEDKALLFAAATLLRELVLGAEQAMLRADTTAACTELGALAARVAGAEPTC